MRQHVHKVAGQEVQINIPEDAEDLRSFDGWIREQDDLVGVDSETTGLDIYDDKFRLRMVQFGSTRVSWVLPVELGKMYADAAAWALGHIRRPVLHNAAYDLQVFQRSLGVPMEETFVKAVDTRIYAHLLDPRGRDEGGIGHGLEDLTRAYVDADVADNVKTLMADLAKESKTTKANVWKKVAIDNERFELYAGMDPILAMRLFKYLENKTPSQSCRLLTYEHRLAHVCAEMEATGFLLDVEYTEGLQKELMFNESLYNEAALKYGCENVNSTDQVADVLERMGVQIKGRTPSGKRQVNDDLLENLRKTGDNHVQEFANSVIEAKKAGKWRKTWIENFLKGRDSQDRCHASINPLRARTARMSITGIPAQTLPAGDHVVRSCFIADEGHQIVSVDYQAQELRVLAALARDRVMTKAFAEGQDLHLLTAWAAFGDHITKDDKERKWAKVVNFGRVYGGGAKVVAEQTGLDFPTAKRVVDGFDRAYPQVQTYSQKLQREAAHTGFVTTPTGRRLPVDPTRAYSALNYVVQSTSRDVTGAALLRLKAAGFLPYMRLPIHDEVLFSMPADKAAAGAKNAAKVMQQQMGQVLIDTDAEVGGKSWGSLYE